MMGKLMSGLKTAAASLVLLGSASGSASWLSRDIVDPITDVKRPIRSVQSADGSSLVLKCDKTGSGEVYVHLVSKKYLGKGRYPRRELTYRIDTAPPVVANWLYDGTSAIAVSDQNSGLERFILNLAAAKKLTIRATTYEYGTVDYIFDVTGAQQAIQEVYSACADRSPLVAG